jgi:hypothetical protein
MYPAHHLLVPEFQKLAHKNFVSRLSLMAAQSKSGEANHNVLLSASSEQQNTQDHTCPSSSAALQIAGGNNP